MVDRDKLTNYISQTLGVDLLAKSQTIDTRPNSVQITGSKKVDRVALGVSCSRAFLHQAIKQKAQYLLVHHGLSADKLVKNGRFDFIEDRLKLIIKNNLTLAGFHYVLDAHPTLGNNAQIIQKLGAKRLNEPYFETWGWVGEFPKPIAIQDLKQQAASLFNHDVYSVLAGPTKVKRIGVCSGGAKPGIDDLFEIKNHQIDLHLTGEISESDPYSAQAGGFNYFACGHYATETFGVKALGDAIQKHFGDKLEVEFIDIPTVL